MLPVLNNPAAHESGPGRMVGLHSDLHNPLPTPRGSAQAGRELKSATFLVKYACNLNCGFCLNAWRGKAQPNDEMSFEQQQKTIQQLKDAGVTQMTFTGGEPTLNPRLAELIQLAHSLGMKTLLQTNGTFLTNKFLTAIKPFLDGVQISLHGLREEQRMLSGVDSFDAIVAGMRRVKAHSINLFANFVITKRNLHCLKSYLALLDSIGVDTASFTRLYPAGKALESWRDLVVSGDEYAVFIRELEQLKKTVKARIYLAGPTDTAFLLEEELVSQTAACGAGRTEIAINPNGDILPCPSWNQSVGNVLTDDIKTAWGAGFLAELGANHDGTKGCMLARKREKRELEP
jgi:MoaA/NifB/PqqE/SkfB family radical SAM enzyme